MSAAAYGIYQGLDYALGSNLIALAAAMAGAVIVYGGLVLRMQILCPEEYALLPGGEKLSSLFGKNS